jgi:hypothetical protein
MRDESQMAVSWWVPKIVCIWVILALRLNRVHFGNFAKSFANCVQIGSTSAPFAHHASIRHVLT